jgi:hypothetical protein
VIVPACGGGSDACRMAGHTDVATMFSSEETRPPSMDKENSVWPEVGTKLNSAEQAKIVSTKGGGSGASAEHRVKDYVALSRLSNCPLEGTKVKYVRWICNKIITGSS